MPTPTDPDPPAAPAVPGAGVEELEQNAIIQGANPFVGMTLGQLLRAGARWGLACGKHPTVLLSEILTWASDEAKVLAGVSDVAPAKGDKRFTDPAWERRLWRRVAQTYLVSR